MSGGWNPGDRVRVTERNRVEGYRPGDKGTVYRIEVASRCTLYHVTMDKDGAQAAPVLFTADEIEPDL